MRVSSIAIFAAFALCVPNGEVLAAKFHPANYDSVRVQLFKLGFQAVKVRHLPRDYYCSEGFCDTYPETIRCTLIGLHYCAMGFFRPSDGRYITITTLGEVEHKLIIMKMADPDDEDMRYIHGRPDEP